MATRTKAAAPTRGTRLFVSGVAPDVKKTDLQQEFGEFGHVVDIEMPLTARGVAFVQFDNPRDAREAMEEVTGRRLKGMVLKVKHADTKPEGKKGPDEPMSKAAHPEEQERRQRAPLQRSRSRSRRHRDSGRRGSRDDRSPPRRRDGQRSPDGKRQPRSRSR